MSPHSTVPLHSVDLESMQQEDEKVRGNRDGRAERETRGYSRLAAAMGQQPDLAIFMRFNALSAEILLHRQAEIVALRDELWECQKNDNSAAKGTNRSEYAHDSATLQASIKSNDPETDDPRQWEIFLELRGKLKEYQEALVAHRQMVEFRQPHRRQVESLVEWMDDQKRGDIFLLGIDSDVWKTTELADLVNMEPSSPDGFTNRWSLGFLYYYDKVIGHRIHATDEAEHSRNAIVYQNQRIMAFARTFKTIVACMFPIVAIITLYFIKTLPVRLGVIGGFTLFFALVLDKATSASVKDIFSATAASGGVRWNNKLKGPAGKNCNAR
ncbi:hypothetical protein BN1708_004917 [Verticillium longisporum]|uniref:DUF6594 domain-containing protein n=2 Tax=Verticillium longisporum TaxID=100787 RepID=A0A0G4M4M8_VERLO|nr:hypothetical protein BN1708_004917 [Verticillium longisporum]